MTAANHDTAVDGKERSASDTATPVVVAPSGYVGWTAEEKYQWLLSTVVEATEYEPVDVPDLAMPPMSEIPSRAAVVLSTDELAKTLDHNGDLMPVNRPKIIHEFGAVAGMTMTIGPSSPFTGVLGAGVSTTGVVRLSLAAPPGLRKSFIPGAGFKFLIDGQPSLDVVAVNHTNGQGRNHNLFANPLSHDITDGHSELRLPQRIMAKLFGRVTSQTRRLRIDHLATWTPSGAKVASPVVPHRIVFRPRVEVARVFRRHPGEDFRSTVSRLDPGTYLYDVVAETTGSGPTPIGYIATSTRFITSAGGDRLFFRHLVEDRRDV